MKKATLIPIIVFMLLFLVIGLDAQCPMCKIASETNMENGGTEGRGLNTGILYMFAAPYLIVATIGFLWWRNRKRFDDSEELLD